MARPKAVAVYPTPRHVPSARHIHPSNKPDGKIRTSSSLKKPKPTDRTLAVVTSLVCKLEFMPSPSHVLSMADPPGRRHVYSFTVALAMHGDVASRNGPFAERRHGVAQDVSRARRYRGYSPVPLSETDLRIQQSCTRAEQRRPTTCMPYNYRSVVSANPRDASWATCTTRSPLCCCQTWS